MSHRLLPFILLVLAIPALVSATTRTVRQDGSGDFMTIGGAVAASSAGDVIEVGPGVYEELVDVYVQLTFISTDGAAATVMDGELAHYTLWFRAGMGHIVDGFTFQNGRHISGGGAIRCQAGATLTLRNSILQNNRSDHDGGALFTRDTGSFIDAYNCVFRNNYADHNGAAGIAILNSRINYTGCQFYNQTCGSQNAGVSCDHSNMDVKNCLFVGNTSDSFAGIYYYMASGNVENNTFYANYSGEWGTVLVHASTVNVRRNIIANTGGGHGLTYLGGSGQHTCNVYYQNAQGSIDGASLGPTEQVADPRFCSAATNNFKIDMASPAAPAHNPCGTLAGAYEVGCGPVAVAISSFEATAREKGVILRASFESNLTVDEVSVYRAEDGAAMVKIATMPSDRNRFEYVDQSVLPGKSYRYQIGVRDADGEFLSQVQRVFVNAVRNGLDQNRPNPFNPTTTIRYTLSSPGHVTLAVYDAAGHHVRTLVDEDQSAGARDAVWDGRDHGGAAVASGVYFYKLTAGKFSETRRMVMLK